MAGPASVFRLLSGSVMAAKMPIKICGVHLLEAVFILRWNSFQPAQTVTLITGFCRTLKFPKHLL